MFNVYVKNVLSIATCLTSTLKTHARSFCDRFRFDSTDSISTYWQKFWKPAEEEGRRSMSRRRADDDDDGRNMNFSLWLVDVDDDDMLVGAFS